jgi:hypothetical protein
MPPVITDILIGGAAVTTNTSRLQGGRDDLVQATA